MMNRACCWLLRFQGQILLTPDETGSLAFPSSLPDGVKIDENALTIGHWQGRACLAADVEHLPENLPGEWVALRQVFATVGFEHFMQAGRASQLLDWWKNNRFCGRCGAKTEKKDDEFGMSCSACGLVSYPRISPAVMVLIRRGRELLLARGPHFKPGVFSALAGFVEVGETIEACAVREVQEEVGLKITNLRYFQSQPWPFPDSLMIAFHADYAGGEIVCDPHEIEAAAWYSIDELPLLPDPVSIARRLIEDARRELGAL